MKDGTTSVKAAARFIFFSLLGIFAFFVRIQIGGEKAVLADHIISWLKTHLHGWYGILACIGSGYALFYKASRREVEKGFADKLFFVWTGLGFFISVCLQFKLGPGELIEAGASAANATGNILCAVFVSSIFVPLFVDYGLVDAAGALCSPFMRRIFHTPGSSAVIGVSAFLGNYSVGHLAARQMYEEGKFTRKETVIVATGFSTCSIGLMLNLVNYMGLTEYWNTYAACVMLVTFAITAVTARIPPIASKPDDYMACAQPKPKVYGARGMFRSFWEEGVARAKDAPRFLAAVKMILKRTFPVICEITGTSMFIITGGNFLLSHTKVFYWIGRPFVYWLEMAGIAEAGRESFLLAQSVGASLLEPVLAGVACSGQPLPLMVRWIIAVVPYSSVIFFAGSIPCIRSARIPCRLSDLLFLWVERTALGIIFAAAAAAILFR